MWKLTEQIEIVILIGNRSLLSPLAYLLVKESLDNIRQAFRSLDEHLHCMLRHRGGGAADHQEYILEVRDVIYEIVYPPNWIVRGVRL